MRAHLLVVNGRGETLIDEDVFDVEVHNVITWWQGDKRDSPYSTEHQVPLGELERIEITTVRDHAALDATRTARRDAGGVSRLPATQDDEPDWTSV